MALALVDIADTATPSGKPFLSRVGSLSHQRLNALSNRLDLLWAELLDATREFLAALVRINSSSFA
jgi:hypothetical protein